MGVRITENFIRETEALRKWLKDITNGEYICPRLHSGKIVFVYFYSCIPYGMYGLKCNQAADAIGLLRLMRRMDGNCRKKVGKDRQ